jgi:hypothetical protein
MTWSDIMPSLAQLDVVVGTPVRIRPGHEPAGWVAKNDQTLTVRPWGDEHPTHCMIIDNTGTSMPVTWKCLTVDLDHPLGFSSALLIFKKLHPLKDDFDTMIRLRNAWLFGPNDEDKRMLAASLVKHLNTTHREV